MKFFRFPFFLRRFQIFQLSGKGKKNRTKKSPPSRTNILHQNMLYDDGMAGRNNSPRQILNIVSTAIQSTTWFSELVRSHQLSQIILIISHLG